MAENRIKLGMTVRDLLTGYEGIAMARAEYLTGCAQIGIKPKGTNKEGTTHDTLYFDEPFVEVVDKNIVQPVTQREADAGGPQDAYRRG